MRRRTMAGIVLGAAMALGAMAVFADDQPYPNPRADAGPIIGKKLVIRRDVGRPGYPVPPPGKVKPVEPGSGTTFFGSAAKASFSGRNAGGATMMATASPQTQLENRLRSLAKELR